MGNRITKGNKGRDLISKILPPCLSFHSLILPTGLWVDQQKLNMKRKVWRLAEKYIPERMKRWIVLSLLPYKIDGYQKLLKL